MRFIHIITTNSFMSINSYGIIPTYRLLSNAGVGLRYEYVVSVHEVAYLPACSSTTIMTCSTQLRDRSILPTKINNILTEFVAIIT